jgi:hypothetical protein
MRYAAAPVLLPWLRLLAFADTRTAFAVLALALLPDVQAPVRVGRWLTVLPGLSILGLLGRTRHERERPPAQGAQQPDKDAAAGGSRAKRASQSVKAGGVHGGGPFQCGTRTRQARLHPRDRNESCQMNLDAMVCGSWRLTASGTAVGPPRTGHRIRRPSCCGRYWTESTQSGSALWACRSSGHLSVDRGTDSSGQHRGHPRPSLW